ncbi:MAG: hypothetical protein RR490_10775 [Niameybacter sp.]
MTKKTNIMKPLAIIGGIYVGLFVIVFGLMMTMAITSGELEGAFETSGSVAVMNIETSMGNHLRSSFTYKNGTDGMVLKRKVGETITLTGEVNIKKGDIIMTISDPNDEVVFTKTYESQNEIEEIQVPVTSEGKYTVRLEINEASGDYNLKASE